MRYEGSKSYKIFRRINEQFFRSIFNVFYGEGVKVMQEDWDNLIILDACRYDIFEQHCHLEGVLKKVISQGSGSREFIKKNFVGGEFHDTVYVGGNGWVEFLLEDDVFYKIEKSYADIDCDKQGWKPEKIYNKTIENYRQHPDKRFVIHFMQPHAPYLGKTAEKLRDGLGEEGFRFDHINKVQGSDHEPKESDPGFRDLLDAHDAGRISKEQLYDLYVENLEIVLGYVEQLLDEIEGKTIVTADHGELLGDFSWAFPGRQVGHPEGIYSKKLREVPWLEIDNGERREIVAEEPVGSQEVDKDVVEENLRALGYVE